MRSPKLATIVALAAALAVAAGLLAAPACIPDLPDRLAPPPSDDSDDGPGLADQSASDSAPKGRCGDGIVQLGPPRNEQCDPGSLPPVHCSAACQVVCDAGVVWPQNNHCYVDLPDAATTDFFAATDLCPYPAQHLVTFASEQEIEAVIGPLDAGSYWVGLGPKSITGEYATTATGPEPGWAPPCAGCFIHSSDAAVIPGSTLANCVQGEPAIDASWQTASCLLNAAPLDVICESEPQGRLWQLCDGGYCFDLVFTYGYKHYVFVPNVVGPAQAAAQCAAMGGTLIVLQTRDEREQLWRELVGLPALVRPVTIWIGLSVQGGTAPINPNNWVWADDASADAYPPEWGLSGAFAGQPVGVPSGGGENAVMYAPQVATDPVDDTLASNDQPGAYPFVCQLPAQ